MCFDQWKETQNANKGIRRLKAKLEKKNQMTPEQKELSDLKQRMAAVETELGRLADARAIGEPAPDPTHSLAHRLAHPDWSRVQMGVEVQVRPNSYVDWSKRIFLSFLPDDDYKVFFTTTGGMWHCCRLVHEKDIPPPKNAYGFYEGQAGYFWNHARPLEAWSGIYSRESSGFHRMKIGSESAKYLFTDFLPAEEYEAKYMSGKGGGE